MAVAVLIVAAHPDDEVLGVGGTVARHTAAGDEVHSVILGSGATARLGATKDEVNSLRDSARQAAEILGAQLPSFCDLPDNKFDSVPRLDIVQRIEAITEALRPTIVYTHSAGDLNIDHRITHAAVMTACRPLPKSGVRSIFGFETVSSTEWSPTDAPVFRPTRYTDISSQLDIKQQALECYSQEMQEFPHARSIKNIRALARFRGASVGLNAAEAFEVLRDIVFASS